jgi:hypothetical protein
MCRECRLEIATMVLDGSEDQIARMWLATADFGSRRRHLVTLNRERADRPRADVLATVARGLLEQGYVDDALILASIAIRLGDEADINQVGASALKVLFDPLLASADIVSLLRERLHKMGSGGGRL